MKKKVSDKISEKIIINRFLQKLNFNRLGTFNFQNDAGYLNISKIYKTIVTTDTISENIDFFQNDPPESVAQKLVCVNLSDLSAMGSAPKAYTLNLSITPKINSSWLKKFINRLFFLQKKYHFYLLGGDISKSKELSISATFFGQAKLKYILSQNKCSIGDDIWVTGNLGNSYLGYKILRYSKLKISKKFQDKFIINYLYPEPCMFGSIAFKYINSAIDISDGFYGDLKKMLNNRFGAIINKKNIPISNNLKRIIIENNFKINIDQVLSWGDDYQLIFIANKKFRNKIQNLGKKNNIKLSNVGSVTKTKGIFDDSMKLIKKLSSFDHFC
ncbi:MAG: thiamine-phosphate kinase [Rickettsiales bacterium]|nr:thiamine-phosphate kinase [Rickettsiales bacterium]